MRKSFTDVRVGDTVVRNLGGMLMKLRVTKVDAFIHCSDWTFSRYSGIEIDPGLGDPGLGLDEVWIGSFLEDVIHEKTS